MSPGTDHGGIFKKGEFGVNLNGTTKYWGFGIMKRMDGEFI